MNLRFSLMASMFRVRDWLLPPGRKLEEAGVRAGHLVLDFGCGPGSYSLQAAKMVGEGGRVYCQDILSVAVAQVRKAAAKLGLSNMEFICSGLETGLESETMDVVLLYDILHHLREPERVLQELHRVLKADGVLSVSDHHLKEEAILAEVTRAGGFALSRQGAHTYSFSKRSPRGQEARLERIEI
jgi:ubiquinone/menaquinone biosynthesis C-methylase UbiE